MHENHFSKLIVAIAIAVALSPLIPSANAGEIVESGKKTIIESPAPSSECIALMGPDLGGTVKVEKRRSLFSRIKGAFLAGVDTGSVPNEPPMLY